MYRSIRSAKLFSLPESALTDAVPVNDVAPRHGRPLVVQHDDCLAAGFQAAVNFPDRLLRSWRVVENAEGINQIERVIGEGQILRITVEKRSLRTRVSKASLRDFDARHVVVNARYLVARLVPLHGVHADANTDFQHGFPRVLGEPYRILQKWAIQVCVYLEPVFFGFLKEGMGIRGLGAVRHAARKRAPEFANGLPKGLRLDRISWLRCFSYHAASLSFHSTVQEKGSC